MMNDNFTPVSQCWFPTYTRDEAVAAMAEWDRSRPAGSRRALFWGGAPGAGGDSPVMATASYFVSLNPLGAPSSAVQRCDED